MVGYLRLVDVGTAVLSAHLLLVVNIGIRIARALGPLYVLARGIEIYAEELADNFFHVCKKCKLLPTLFRIFGFFLFCHIHF